MDTLEAIQKRKSIRSYLPEPVPKVTLVKLLEAARIAPSAGNRQPWHFVVVTDAEKRKALSKGVFARFLTEVPAVIVACGDTNASAEWCAVDVSLAVENLILAATSEGLGTCCIGSFSEANVKKVLAIPSHLSVIVMVAVGYPKEKQSLTSKVISLVRKRKTLSEITSWEMYGRESDGE